MGVNFICTTVTMSSVYAYVFIFSYYQKNFFKNAIYHYQKKYQL